MMSEKSDFSIFVADHLEKLLHAQHKADKIFKFNRWIAKLNDLDFQKRTSTFFHELHLMYKAVELVGPIKNRFGILSRNLSETLENWTSFYSDLYTDSKT